MTKARWAREKGEKVIADDSSAITGNLSIPAAAAVGDTEKIIKSGARTARKAVQRRGKRRRTA
jgi:hypothetical protein